MKATLERLAGRFEALTRRERLIVARAIVGGILFLGGSGFVEPALTRERLVGQQVQQQRADIANLQAQIVALQVQAEDPDHALHARLDEARRKLSSADTELRKAGQDMVPPQRMVSLLEEFVTRNRGLRLLSLSTLPPEALIARMPAASAATPVPESGADAAKGAAAAAPLNVFRHGVEIRVEGSYADLTAYLAELEKLPQRVLWGRVAVDAENYPRIAMTVTVFTLSLDKSWLVV
jgi:MSHA biogenesis protein MshJ